MNLKSKRKETSDTNSAQGVFSAGFSKGNIFVILLQKNFSSFSNLINPNSILTNVLCAISQLRTALANGPEPQYVPVRVRVNKFL